LDCPRDITPGMSGVANHEGHRKCKIMVLVFSANANESVRSFAKSSPPCIGQADSTAADRGYPTSDSMAFFMNSVHWLDAIQEPHERYWINCSGRRFSAR